MDSYLAAATEDILVAAFNGDVGALQHALLRGGDPNARNMHGNPAADIACWRGHPQCLRALIDSGADINAIRNKEVEGEFREWYPAKSAIWYAEIECLELIINAGGRLPELDFACYSFTSLTSGGDHPDEDRLPVFLAVVNALHIPMGDALKKARSFYHHAENNAPWNEVAAKLEALALEQMIIPAKACNAPQNM